jgi:F-type H+-transporting ATPase subunit epsilon
MIFRMVTLLGVKVEQDVYEVIIPTPQGEIAVFPDHEALVSLVTPGAISVRHQKNDPDSKLEFFAITGGVVEIAHNQVRVLVDEADHGDDIIEAESRDALKRAIEMRDNAHDQVELEQAQQLVDRHAVRLKVAELRRRRRG